MANVKISNLSTVWTSSLTEHDGIKLTVTDTASSGSSKLINLLIGTTSKFSVGKDSVVTADSFVGQFTGPLSGTASYSNSASYALNAPNFSTGSSHNITSSWASNASTASYIGIQSTASYSDNSRTSSYALNAPNLATGSSYNITSSWSLTASHSNTASYALNAPNLATGSSYNITSSWASNASTASYVSTQSTSSYSDNSKTSSYALNAPNFSTGSSHNITSSWATRSVSSSHSTNSDISITASYVTSSNVFGTVSSASYALNAPNFSTGSSHNITSSWSAMASTASYVSVQNSASYSVTSSYALNAPNLTTGSSYNITSSWSANASTASYVSSSAVFGTVTSASHSLTSSFALNSSNGGTVLGSGSIYNITASWSSNSSTASYASTSVSASYALSASYAPGSPSVSASYALSASYAPGSPSVSASYALSASYATSSSHAISSSHSITSSFSISASHALSSSHAITASYADRYAPLWPSSVQITGSGFTEQSGINYIATSASFTLIASALGDTPMYYNWYINSSSLLQSGSANSYNVTESVKNIHSGYYTCNVTNSFGTSTSANFTITVLDPVVITSETPPSATPTINSVVTFAVTATGDQLSYIWRRTSNSSYLVNGTPNIFTTGTTTPTMTLQALASVPPNGMEGSYACEVSNIVSEASSSEMPIYTSAPTILTNPSSINSSGFAALTATGSAISYSWEYGGIAVTGQTAATLDLTTAVNDGYFTQTMIDQGLNLRARVYNQVGSVYGNNIQIKPFRKSGAATPSGAGTTTRGNGGPIVAGNATNCFVYPSDTVFAWYRDGVSVGADINAFGETTPKLTLYNVQTADQGSYICSASNANGSAASDVVTLTVSATNTHHNSSPSQLYIYDDETYTLLRDDDTNISTRGSSMGATTYDNINMNFGAGFIRIDYGWRSPTFGPTTVFSPTQTTITAPCPDGVTIPMTNTFTTATKVLTGSTISENQNWYYQWIGASGVAAIDCVNGNGPYSLPYIWPFSTSILDLTAHAGSQILTDSGSVGGQTLYTVSVMPKNSPGISSQPATSQSAVVGDSVSMTVSVVEGDYVRWYKNGVLQPAETSTTYTIPAVSLSDSGSYYCKVANKSTFSYKVMNSSSSRLDVAPA